MEQVMEGSGSFSDMLEGTSDIARDLEALRNEHQHLLASYHTPDKTDYGEEDLWDAELEEAVKREKEEIVNQSMSKLEEGMTEAKLMLMLANYVNSLESDKQKLKAQVKRLCSENSWLRQELTGHQQKLQEAEIALCKYKEEIEQLEFSVRQYRTDARERSPAMDIDVQEVNEIGAAGGSDAVDYEVPDKIKTLHHLALQYVNQGKPEVAIPLCKKVVKELELKTGRDNPELAAMLSILAVIYREQGKLKEATKVLQETLDIRERVFGNDHPAVAATLNNLSVLHGKCGDYKRAEPYCRKALEIRQKLLGGNHPDVAKQFTNLAILCSHLGKYDEVEYYYQRALEIYQTELGADDPNVTKTMSDLATCYLKQGKYKASENIYKKVLTTVQQSEGPQSTGPSTWVLPGNPRSPTGKRDEGKWHKTAQPHSPTVSSTLKSLSLVYREQGRVDTANELEELTSGSSLDQSQKERVSELLSSEPPSPATTSAQSGPKQSRPARGSLSKNVKRFLWFKSKDTD